MLSVSLTLKVSLLQGFVYVCTDSMDTTRYSGVTMALWLFVGSTSWERSDSVKLWLQGADKEAVVFEASDFDHDDRLDEGVWQEIVGYGEGMDAVQMCFGLTSNHKLEDAFFDHLRLTGLPRGGTACVQLESEPLLPVSVSTRFTSGQDGNATVSAVAPVGDLLFDAASWYTPQCVDLHHREDDLVATMPHEFAARFTATSADVAYQGVRSEISAVLFDDDHAMLMASASSMDVTSINVERYTLVLTSQPIADVVVRISIDALNGTSDASLQILPSAVLFTNESWASPVDIFATAIAATDGVARSFHVRHTVESPDQMYDTSCQEETACWMQPENIAKEQGFCRDNGVSAHSGGIYGGWCGTATATPEECYAFAASWPDFVAAEWRTSSNQCALLHHSSAAPSDCPAFLTPNSGNGGDTTVLMGDGGADNVCWQPNRAHLDLCEAACRGDVTTLMRVVPSASGAASNPAVRFSGAGCGSSACPRRTTR